MKNLTLSLLLTLLWTIATAQVVPLPADTVPAIINYKNEAGGIRFSSILRPLRQIAGAPEPFYTYFWEFGDGAFSFEKEPAHFYMDSLMHQVRLFATNSYDDGKRPPTRPKPMKPGSSRPVLATNMPPASIFKHSGSNSLEMKTNCMPKPGEDMMLLIGYRNKQENGIASLNGTITILYNDKAFNKDNFELVDSRTYHQEKKTPVVRQNNMAVLKQSTATELYYASGPNQSAEASPVLDLENTAKMNEQMNAFRKAESWKFENLKPGKEQYIFLEFKTTPEMIKDTNAVVHLNAIFQPDNPMLPAEFFSLELQIVASHDPNKMMLKNSRMNYRFTGKNKKLTYKIRFQNTGKGPAKKVAVGVAIPPNLDIASIKVLDSKPKLINCDSAYANQSCLDTLRQADSIRFIFKNIYLPGLQQKGVQDADSTMGYITYSISFLEKPKKLPFKSGAAIVFDKNEPIYTNQSTGKYKTGISPGIIAGYGFPFENGNTPFSGQKNITFGASISPYAPHRYFLQAELYMNTFAEKTYYFDRKPGNGRIISIEGKREAKVDYVDSTAKIRVITLNLVPLQIRRNFNKYFGAGVGTLVSFNLNKQTTPGRTIALESSANGPLPPIQETLKKIKSSFSDFQQTLFADIQLGKVHTGPAIGFRYLFTLQNSNNRLISYLSWKF